MEGLAEQLVAIYLTRGGKVFIVPQYSVPDDTGKRDWSCPDFVALSFEKPTSPKVIVVEISIASDWRVLRDRVREKELRWYDRLRAKLLNDGVIDLRWSFGFLGFVRSADLERLRSEFKGVEGVQFKAIEDASFAWNYWEERFGAALFSNEGDKN